MFCSGTLLSSLHRNKRNLVVRDLVAGNEDAPVLMNTGECRCTWGCCAGRVTYQSSTRLGDLSFAPLANPMHETFLEISSVRVKRRQTGISKYL